MSETASQHPEWRDVRYLRTHQGMLVYWTADGADFAQEEADIAPKNLIIARHPQLGWQLIRLQDATAQIPAPPAIADALRNPDLSTVIEDVKVDVAPGPDNVALRRGSLYLSAGKAPELTFAARHRLAWEIFEAARPTLLAYQLWRPSETMGGTQLMLFGLAERLGPELNAIDLHLHRPPPDRDDSRPLVIWLHNDANDSFRWCADPERTRDVAAFVFVSHWQCKRFLTRFPNLPAERCHVIRNATPIDAPIRPWPAVTPWRWRCAYTSAPNRGLSILLDAWERLAPANAELHIWSSFRLWGKVFSDKHSHAVFAKARSLPGVIYHGISANAEIRQALRDMHFLTYPSTFNETSCIAVMEAMAAGVRVVATSWAALPETTAGFAHLYLTSNDREAQVAAMAEHLAEEFRSPWGGRPALAVAAQEFARAVYDWPNCVDAWRQLIRQLTRPQD